jgi:hypothetical protein
MCIYYAFYIILNDCLNLQLVIIPKSWSIVIIQTPDILINIHVRFINLKISTFHHQPFYIMSSSTLIFLVYLVNFFLAKYSLLFVFTLQYLWQFLIIFLKEPHFDGFKVGLDTLFLFLILLDLFEKWLNISLYFGLSFIETSLVVMVIGLDIEKVLSCFHLQHPFPISKYFHRFYILGRLLVLSDVLLPNLIILRLWYSILLMLQVI